MTTRLQRRLEALYGLERRKDKLGLDGTRTLLRALGDPHTRFRSVHVAGTNGKGSVCALIERVLREAGHRTGLYTSPHLVDFRERIRVNGRWADEDWLDDALERIESLPEGRDRTFFEVATALGFLYFAERGVEIAVVEVGLGGRLDSTNVITPEVSVITSISLDHGEILGGTLEAIAAEKAGILKPGVPAVATLGTDAAGQASRGPELEVIERKAREVGAPLTWADPYGGAKAGGLAAGGLRGPHQASNLSTALAAVEVLTGRGLAIPAAAVAEGLRRARWPGRFEPAPREPRLWWDGAHNPAAMLALADAWRAERLPPPRAAVLALSRDKPADAMMAALRVIAPQGLSVLATRTGNARAMEPRVIVAAAAAAGFSATEGRDVPSACRLALERAAPDGLVLLAGSLFAVAEAMEAFGGAPGEQA